MNSRGDDNDVTTRIVEMRVAGSRQTVFGDSSPSDRYPFDNALAGKSGVGFSGLDIMEDGALRRPLSPRVTGHLLTAATVWSPTSPRTNSLCNPGGDYS
jgi:hypothetical protein